jgi:hypothetical protein
MNLLYKNGVTVVRWHGKAAERCVCIDFFATFFVKKKSKENIIKQNITALLTSSVKIKSQINPTLAGRQH